MNQEETKKFLKLTATIHYGDQDLDVSVQCPPTTMTWRGRGYIQGAELASAVRDFIKDYLGERKHDEIVRLAKRLLEASEMMASGFVENDFTVNRKSAVPTKAEFLMAIDALRACLERGKA